VTTGFEAAVLAVVRSIRPGDVLTYGEVAAEAGRPGAARAVGTLLRTTDVEIPWWRVVGAGGRLRAPDPAAQARRLRTEGVVVDGLRVRPSRQETGRAY
jgi:methylated-DNA-protein-cysteine methyltransferase-like protein